MVNGIDMLPSDVARIEPYGTSYLNDVLSQVHVAVHDQLAASNRLWSYGSWIGVLECDVVMGEPDDLIDIAEERASVCRKALPIWGSSKANDLVTDLEGLECACFGAD